jgi:hypothetical protein
LHASGDSRDFVCVRTGDHAYDFLGATAHMLINRSEFYAGSLIVVAVPKGSV